MGRVKDVSTFDVEEVLEERVGCRVNVEFVHCCMVEVEGLDSV